MGFKSTLKKTVSRLIQSDFLWKILDATFLQLARYIEWEHLVQKRRLRGIPIEVTAIERFCPDLTVKHGPFQGLQYPKTTIIRGTIQNVAFAEINLSCRNLFPKLIGSYERELHPVIHSLSDRTYSEIINVGCAEGFYAVGCALKFPEAEVYAYDLKPEAQQHCFLMAQLNQCAQRMHIQKFCDPETLSAIPINGKGLIICDCEGYETELFTAEVIPHLKQCDLLIELHDFLDMTISETIRQRFAGTHEITMIQSTDDNQKARTYPIAELAGFDLNDRRNLLRENRESLMDWIFLTPMTAESP